MEAAMGQAIVEQNLTDLRNSELLLDGFGPFLRYDWDAGMWFVFDQGERIWHEDRTGEVYELAKTAVKDFLWADVTEAGQAGRKADAGKLLRHAIRSGSRAGIEAMVSLARSDYRVSVQSDVWDADPLLVGVKGGAVDLREGKFRETSHVDLISRRVNAKYDSAALYPKWEKFLTEVFCGDKELMWFTQKSLGLALSGSVDAQRVWITIGSGMNGKSVFHETLLRLFGDYGHRSPAEMLLAQKNSNAIPSDVRQLQGVRYAVIDEIPENRRLNSARLKALSGGDQVQARAMYADWQSFRPTAKIWMNGNFLPNANAGDDALWRRLTVIPFRWIVPAAQRRPMSELVSGFLEEGPGLLNWLIKGYAGYTREGLTPCPAVESSTAEYRTSEDTMQVFIDEVLSTGNGSSITTAELHRAYSDWCARVGERPSSRRQVTDGMKKRGFLLVEQSERVRYFRGVGLASDGSAGSDH